MKTYKEFMNNENELNEITSMGIAVERKLSSAVTKIKSTNDISKKLDLLIQAIHFSIASIALEVTKSNNRRRR